MSALPETQPKKMTEAEYLVFEQASEFKHEFINGKIYAMVGASPAHNKITVNTSGELHYQLKGRPCDVYSSDQKVRTPMTGAYLYPDITVVCGEERFADDENGVLLNPIVVIEVLSPSTELFDRTRKFQRYQEIDSLQEYILIAQDRPHIEHYARQEDGRWLLDYARGMDATLDLAAIGCTLALVDVYEKIEFAPDPDDTPND